CPAARLTPTFTARSAYIRSLSWTSAVIYLMLRRDPCVLAPALPRVVPARRALSRRAAVMHDRVRFALERGDPRVHGAGRRRGSGSALGGKTGDLEQVVQLRVSQLHEP